MDNLGFGSTSNPYLDKSVTDALGDTTKAYNMTTAPAYTSAMVRSGSFGNSGVQQMQDEAQRQQQTAQGRQANDMRSQNYQFGQEFDRGVYNDRFNQDMTNLNFDRGTYNDRFNQNQQSINTGMNLLNFQNQNQQQNLGFGTQIQNTPMNYYQGFAGTANGIGQGYGTTSGSSNNSSGGRSAPGSAVMGALGGAQLGNSFGKQVGNMFGGGNNQHQGFGNQSTPLGGFFYGNGSSGD